VMITGKRLRLSHARAEQDNQLWIHVGEKLDLIVLDSDIVDDIANAKGNVATNWRLRA